MKLLIAGTFDNFHVGHQWLIWSAYQKGSELVIIVARDETVAHIKQREPKNNEQSRLARIEQEIQGYPNIKVRLGRADQDFMVTIAEETPDMIYLGYDQQFNADSVNILTERATAYAPDFFKSSKF